MFCKLLYNLELKTDTAYRFSTPNWKLETGHCKLCSMKPKIKLKPWGREIWWADQKKYAGKILEVNRGARLSLQYHRYKEETQYLFSGKVRMIYGENKNSLHAKLMRPGDVFHIPPALIHRVEGLAPKSIIFEVSTPHLNDVIKLSDDYGRSGSGNNEKLDRKLAKRKGK